MALRHGIFIATVVLIIVLSVIGATLNWRPMALYVALFAVSLMYAALATIIMRSSKVKTQRGRNVIWLAERREGVREVKW